MQYSIIQFSTECRNCTSDMHSNAVLFTYSPCTFSTPAEVAPPARVCCATHWYTPVSLDWLTLLISSWLLITIKWPSFSIGSPLCNQLHCKGVDPLASQDRVLLASARAVWLPGPTVMAGGTEKPREQVTQLSSRTPVEAWHRHTSLNGTPQTQTK